MRAQGMIAESRQVVVLAPGAVPHLGHFET
jgi:hypothetical protein